MDEFELIRRYFKTLTPPRRDVRLGIGDDAALLKLPPGHELAVTTDTLVAGRHFAEDAAPEGIGWKSLAVNLSDLAAMGAEPRWFTLALTVRLADPLWLQGFAAGLRASADAAQVTLVGGDTTQGPLSITITAMGVVPAGRAIRRSGAKPGDAICVTGTLGDAALALELGEQAPVTLKQRLHRPMPRLKAGRALCGIARAAIDLSDGLAGDLDHILAASGVGADIHIPRLPASMDFATLVPPESRLKLQVAGGDDYELCFCLPPAQLKDVRRKLGVPVTEIGRISKTKGLRFLDASGKTVTVAPHGYRHFV